MTRSAWLTCVGLLLAACSTPGETETETAANTESGSESQTDSNGESESETGDELPAEPEYAPDELGPFEVGYSQLNVVDPAREDRPLLVDVWYPAEAVDAGADERAGYLLGGLFTLPSEVAWADVPVSERSDQIMVVFSHGYRGISTQSFQLCETLASHGFIVVSPEHTGNSQADDSDDFDAAAANRVPDVSFLIDLFLAKHADPQDPFHGRLNPEDFGVVGHSFGGMTAIGAAAGWAGADADPRVKAVAPISAVIDATMQADTRTSPNAGFGEQQLGEVSVPVMLIGGTEDVGVPVSNNALAFDWLTGAPAVYRADIIGANHTHFSNVCAIGDLLIQNGVPQESWEMIGAGDLIAPYNATCGPEAFSIDEATRLQDLYVVAFFRRYLLGEGDYDHYLSPEYADSEPAITYWERE